MSILKTSNLDAGYKQKTIVENINMVLNEGKIVVLVGPNGVGKSTILKTVSGFLEGRSGAIYLDGQEFSHVSSKDRANLMAVMMTERNNVEYPTVHDLVAAGRYQYTGIFGKLSLDDNAVIDNSLKKVHAFDYKDIEFNKLSDGQKQRVLLARALVQEPKVLILDEPTSFLDIGYKLEFINLIRNLASKDNIAILMSMHELELAKAVADEVICIEDDGRIGRCGAPNEVLSFEYVSRLFNIEGLEFERIYNWENPHKTRLNRFNAGRKTKYIFVQGTMSSAGKSLIVAGLCRIFSQDGYRVAPFKSQNMALNSYVTANGLEMGRAQVMQAEASRIEPSVYMNPILLKPTGNSVSQVIVNGEVVGNMSSKEYFEYKTSLKEDILKATAKLEEIADIIVVEGAGSPVELNLKSNDIVNMGLAKMLDAPVILVGDIDRGGIFPQLIGTMSLLEQEERDRVCGLIVNKFRGDRALFEDGVGILEEKSGTEVLGVMPFIKLNLEDEDSVSDKLDRKISKNACIGIIKLPHISNFTDFDVFEQVENLSVGYITRKEELDNVGLLIIPGSKNTIEDMEYLKATGMDAAIKDYAKKGNVIFGICGGYQLLGETIEDPYGVENGGSISGLGLLPVKTTLTKEKMRTQKNGRITKANGALSKLSGVEYEGYEIHMGNTTCIESLDEFTDSMTGYSKENIYGSYIHGIFDKKDVLSVVVDYLKERTGLDIISEEVSDYKDIKDREFDRLAEAMRQNLNIPKIYEILGLR